MFKPLNNRILIKPFKESITESGIFLAEGKEKPVKGVVEVGNKKVKKGDTVLFSKFGFDEVEIEKEIYYVVADFSILGIF